jgi:hypothetical protein
MPNQVLRNPRHERFAQELATGKTTDAAYVLAGYKENRSNAARLNASQNIQKRVAKIQSMGAERAAITIETLIAEGGTAGVNARDRIEKGPWQNAKGVVVAKSVEDLHSDSNNINKQTALTEKGEIVSGRGDAVNMHDILTGSDPQGLYSTAGGDTTCGNWTKSGDGSAIVGHHDRIGLKDTRHMNSWNSSHGSRGCSEDNLKSTGGVAEVQWFQVVTQGAAGRNATLTR